jgi:hypothetical protein
VNADFESNGRWGSAAFFAAAFLNMAMDLVSGNPMLIRREGRTRVGRGEERKGEPLRARERAMRALDRSSMQRITIAKPRGKIRRG